MTNKHLLSTITTLCVALLLVSCAPAKKVLKVPAKPPMQVHKPFERPSWSKNRDKQVVLLKASFGGEETRPFCSGVMAKDPDSGNTFLWTAAHCCEATIDEEIEVVFGNGKVKHSDPIGFYMMDTKGMDVCRVSIQERHRSNVQLGSLPFMWSRPGHMPEEDHALYIMTHFPNYCNLEVSRDSQHNWCEQWGMRMTCSDVDSSRIFYMAFKGSGGGMSGSPIFDLRGKVIGLLSAGYPSDFDNPYETALKHVGLYAPLDGTVFGRNL